MKLAVYAVACVVLFLSGCAKMTEDELWQKVDQLQKNNNTDLTIEQRNNNIDSTIQVCQTILKDYPAGKDAPAALYMLGETYQNGKHDYHAAVNYYGAFIRQYPDLNSTPVAMFVIGFIYNNNLQMVDSARIVYQSFIAKFPNHELAPSAKFELDNLGKTPDEIIAMKKDVSEKSKKSTRKK